MPATSTMPADLRACLERRATAMWGFLIHDLVQRQFCRRLRDEPYLTAVSRYNASPSCLCMLSFIWNSSEPIGSLEVAVYRVVVALLLCVNLMGVPALAQEATFAPAAS